ncbi:MAG: nucleotidyltransferase family protein [Chloroflexi bacterium]|nr:nucleotidyltransferase family protein [Chloroflexota bacterium]
MIFGFISCILLAAGESTRMGSPKPLLPWPGGNLIQYHLRELTAAGADQIVVVLGHEAERVLPYVKGEGIRAAVNERYKEGRATSLRAGASAISNAPYTILVLSVDQPRPRAIIEAVLRAHQAGDALITIPTYCGRRGHPPAFDGSLLSELASVTDETLGLRAVMQRHAPDIREVAVGSPFVLLDINTPQDYERARLAFATEQP